MINKSISIENAKIVLRNFSGKEGQYNPPGQRNFCVLLDFDLAKELEHDGWNVRYFRAKEPDEERQPYLPVKVNYNNFPPKITVINNSGPTIIDEESVHILDWAEVQNVDLILRPYNWEVGGKKGVKAYLKVMYITIVEDEFEKKYRTIPSPTVDDSDPPWD